MVEENFPEQFPTKVCKLAGIEDNVRSTITEVIRVKRGDRIVKVSRKKHGVFSKWKLVISHVGRRSFAKNQFGENPTPIIILAIDQNHRF